MNLSPARNWLPDSAFLGKSTMAPLADAVGVWSGQWLSTGELSQNSGWRKFLGPIPEMRVSVGEGSAILCPQDSRLELASLLLASEVSARRLRTVQDRRVIDHLVDEALAGLAAALRDVLSTAGYSDEGPYYALDFGHSPSEAVLAVTCSHSCLIELARSQAQPSRGQTPTEPLTAVISGQAVSIGAMLGNCRLTLAEIEALDVGDIIVLDQRTRTPIDLMIGGGNAARSVAVVSAGAQKLTLVIERNSDKW
jgi:flagellar motor switch/type III secretory pathway protein FliN